MLISRRTILRKKTKCLVISFGISLRIWFGICLEFLKFHSEYFVTEKRIYRKNKEYCRRWLQKDFLLHLFPMHHWMLSLSHSHTYTHTHIHSHTYTHTHIHSHTYTHTYTQTLPSSPFSSFFFHSFA